MSSRPACGQERAGSELRAPPADWVERLELLPAAEKVTGRDGMFRIGLDDGPARPSLIERPRPPASRSIRWRFEYHAGRRFGTTTGRQAARFVAGRPQPTGRYGSASRKVLSGGPNAAHLGHYRTGLGDPAGRPIVVSMIFHWFSGGLATLAAGETSAPQGGDRGPGPRRAAVRLRELSERWRPCPYSPAGALRDSGRRCRICATAASTVLSIPPEFSRRNAGEGGPPVALIEDNTDNSLPRRCQHLRRLVSAYNEPAPESRRSRTS